MSKASVIKIYTTTEPGKEMNSMESVTAVAGRGLIGDRYYSLSGNFSKSEIEPD